MSLASSASLSSTLTPACHLPALYCSTATDSHACWVGRLQDLDPLQSLPKLRYLSLIDNPVTKQANYRCAGGCRSTAVDRCRGLGQGAICSLCPQALGMSRCRWCASCTFCLAKASTATSLCCTALPMLLLFGCGRVQAVCDQPVQEAQGAGLQEGQAAGKQGEKCYALEQGQGLWVYGKEGSWLLRHAPPLQER